MDFLELASDCAAFVDPQNLAAIVKTESNYQPFSIGVNGGSRLERQPVNLEEAVVTAQWLLDNGNKPALPYALKAQHPDSQPASLSVEHPQIVAQALVYANEGNPESHYPEEVVAGSVGNAYGSDMATVMVYR